MAVFKPLILDPKEQDLKKTMTKLYRFSEDLKFSLANLDLEDNLGKSVVDLLDQRGDKVREIKFDADGLRIIFDDYSTDVHTRLVQAEGYIELLVSRGDVVRTMLTRMELYGEHITLKTGQVIIDTKNMQLDKAGNTRFSGDIFGKSININNRFIVNSNGDCYIDDQLITGTLNPAHGIYAAELEVYNDSEMVNNITGTVDTWEAYISEGLYCRQAIQFSDRRLKEHIEAIPDGAAAQVISRLSPVTFTFIGSGTRSAGYIAQDVCKIQGSYGIPMVSRIGAYLHLPYESYSALYAGAIKNNQARIERLKREVEGMV